MRKFILVFEGLDVTNEIRLRDLLGENGYKFWHRFPGVWIVIAPDEVTVEALRDMVTDDPPLDCQVLVAEFRSMAGALRARDGAWLEKHLNMKFVSGNVEQKDK